MKVTRGAAGQEFLKKDASRALVDQVKVDDIKVSLPEVVSHNFPFACIDRQKPQARSHQSYSTSTVDTGPAATPIQKTSVAGL